MGHAKLIALLIATAVPLSARATPLPEKAVRMRVSPLAFVHVGDAMQAVREAARIANKPVELVFHDNRAHGQSNIGGVVLRASPPDQKPTAGDGQRVELTGAHFFPGTTSAVIDLQRTANKEGQPLWLLHVPQVDREGRPVGDDEKAPIVVQAYPVKKT